MPSGVVHATGTGGRGSTELPPYYGELKIEHGKLARRLGFKTYFADPYSSWQRGTNENTNGLIRQYLPKRCDISATSHQRVARIAEALNNRPRKCLAYCTPAEVFGDVLRFNL